MKKYSVEELESAFKKYSDPLMDGEVYLWFEDFLRVLDPEAAKKRAEEKAERDTFKPKRPGAYASVRLNRMLTKEEIQRGTWPLRKRDWHITGWNLDFESGVTEVSLFLPTFR